MLIRMTCGYNGVLMDSAAFGGGWEPSAARSELEEIDLSPVLSLRNAVSLEKSLGLT